MDHTALPEAGLAANEGYSVRRRRSSRAVATEGVPRRQKKAARLQGESRPSAGIGCDQDGEGTAGALASQRTNAVHRTSHAASARRLSSSSIAE